MSKDSFPALSQRRDSGSVELLNVASDMVRGVVPYTYRILMGRPGAGPLGRFTARQLYDQVRSPKRKLKK